MRVLVTGANGLVGGRLLRLLVSRGHTAVGMGRGAQRVSGDWPYYAADLGDAAAVSRIVETAKPEAIVNCGGMTDVDGCERDRPGAWRANVDGVASLCLAANAGNAHLVHVSTDYVFDGQAGPYDVDAVPNPRGVYAVTKFAGELAVQTLAGSYTIARTAVVYGWPSALAGKNNFGSWLVGALREGKKVKLFDDQWVSPTLALNVASMLCDLAVNKRAGLFHVSGAEVVDRVTFGLALAKQFGFDPALIEPSHMRDVPLAASRPSKSGLIVTKTTNTLAADARPLHLSAALQQFFTEYHAAQGA